VISMVVDFHIHYCPEKYIMPFLGPGGTPSIRFTQDGIVKENFFSLRCDLPKLIGMMDDSGVDMAVLSSGLGMRSDIEDCRFINDDIKLRIEEYPGRLAGIAHVPPLGGRESFDELRRCRDELGYKGAAMHSVVRGLSIDSAELYPFFEAVEELGMFLIIHPGASALVKYFDYDLGRSVCREGQLAETMVRLIDGGIPDRFPQLKIVMSHLGGHFYASLSRIESYQDKEFWGTSGHPRHGQKSTMPFRWYLDKMFFDAGGILGDVNPIRMALLELKPQNILYGTEYPTEIRESSVVSKYISDIRALPLPQGDIDDLLGNNALRLLGMM